MNQETLTKLVLFIVILFELGGASTDNGSQSLPAWCYDPSGDNCRFYRECLAARYTCEAETDSYALAFGEALCNSFTNQRGDFSNIGQHWVDTTRTCLQKKLVPVLTSNQTLTCEEIKSFAFDTHTDCYITPELGLPSFCELPFSDWFRISWIVKESFLNEPTASVKQAGHLLGGCVSSLFG